MMSGRTLDSNSSADGSAAPGCAGASARAFGSIPRIKPRPRREDRLILDFSGGGGRKVPESIAVGGLECQHPRTQAGHEPEIVRGPGAFCNELRLGSFDRTGRVWKD